MNERQVKLAARMGESAYAARYAQEVRKLLGDAPQPKAEDDSPRHETRADAFAQLSLARVGSNVNATRPYLLALRGFLYDWAHSVEVEIDRHDRAAAMADAARDMEAEVLAAELDAQQRQAQLDAQERDTLRRDCV